MHLLSAKFKQTKCTDSWLKDHHSDYQLTILLFFVLILNIHLHSYDPLFFILAKEGYEMEACIVCLLANLLFSFKCDKIKA